jgi:hypothetical protein
MTNPPRVGGGCETTSCARSTNARSNEEAERRIPFARSSPWTILLVEYEVFKLEFTHLYGDCCDRRCSVALSAEAGSGSSTKVCRSREQFAPTWSASGK